MFIGFGRDRLFLVYSTSSGEESTTRESSPYGVQLEHYGTCGSITVLVYDVFSFDHEKFQSYPDYAH